MKKFPILILLLTFFIELPSYANQANEKNNFKKMRKRFERLIKIVMDFFLRGND